MRRTKEDARRSCVPLPGWDGDCEPTSVDATTEVLTMGAGLEDPANGRMITSPPSNVSAESLELSSVSGLTGSVLTMMGYKADNSKRT